MKTHFRKKEETYSCLVRDDDFSHIYKDNHIYKDSTITQLSGSEGLRMLKEDLAMLVSLPIRYKTIMKHFLRWCHDQVTVQIGMPNWKSTALHHQFKEKWFSIWL